ncbi:unnamed protein product [Mycena citricolor]|uniref:Survival protein SurE-like phosphatase/nucleotidase domain-containing protein n=1 Tax=Mycena citricolor TaxID=2018698 RepID=A0AAD2HKS5_9AGAR|nr:unnamed protein product [Mycena citricolor]
MISFNAIYLASFVVLASAQNIYSRMTTSRMGRGSGSRTERCPQRRRLQRRHYAIRSPGILPLTCSPGRLVCPAINKSGTGSSTTTPTKLTQPCEFNTCPTGSPAEGFNATNSRLNWVNGFPVDSAKFGIQTLGPKFFGGAKPVFVVSGPNVGTRFWSLAQCECQSRIPSNHHSSTSGAATEAAKEGIPAAAFSAATGDQISFTTLTTSPNSTDSRAAIVYSQLTTKVLSPLFCGGSPHPARRNRPERQLPDVLRLVPDCLGVQVRAYAH